MGGISAKLSLSDTEPESEPLPGTPAHVRTVEKMWDPRSPSEDIVRTPIQLDMTPGPSNVDPRSPSVGIVRTPIFYGTKEQIIGEIEPIGLTRSQSVPDDLPGRCSPEPENDPEPSVEEEWASFTSHRTTSEPDLIHDEEKLLEALDKVQIPDTVTAKSRIPQATFKVKSTEKDVSRPASKPLPKSSSEHQRSPLSTRNVDVNSPRVIVQRKQASRLGMLKGNQIKMKPLPTGSRKLYTPFENDKENVDA